jgi:hypothetical protein
VRNLPQRILNNDASIVIQKRVSPKINVPSLIQVKFNNEIRKETISSTSFTYTGFQAYIGDDGLGNINIFRYGSDNEKINVVPLAGTVNYATGLIEVQNFSPEAISGIELKINATSENMDVIPQREQILVIEADDASIAVIGEQT